MTRCIAVIQIVLANLALLSAAQSARGVDPSFGQLFSKDQVPRPGDEKLSRQLSEKLLSGKASLLNIQGLEPSAASAIRPPLTPESLSTMLDDLALSPIAAPKAPGGPTGFAINYKRGDWTIVIGVVLLADRRTVLMGVPVAYNVDAARITAQQWEELLSANDAIGPCSFAYTRDIRQLGIYHSERNIDISPVSMRTWIEQLADLTIATHDKWRPFAASKTAAAP